MKIEQLMNKERNAQYQLLKLLYDSEEAVQLKDSLVAMNLSRVTLLKYIEHINDLFENKAINCRLLLTDDCIKLKEDYHFTWSDLISILLEDSIPYQMLRYFCCHETFQVTKLSQELMISEATFNRQLALINTLLVEFDISITQGKQQGSELQWRYFFYKLLSISLSQSEKKSFMHVINHSHLKNLAEKLTGHPLDTTQVEDLTLWLAISRHRFFFEKEKRIAKTDLANYFQENVFYLRLERLMIRYLSRFAIEFDRFESQCLIIFLHTHTVLPIPSMEYILGFGGPISDKISEALWILRKAKIIGEKTKEEVIYGLSHFFSHLHFLKGTIVSNSKNSESLKQLLSQEDRMKIDLVMPHLFGLVDYNARLHTETLNELEFELVELLIFSIEKHQKPLKIGLDIGKNPVKIELIKLTLKKFLDNNLNYQFYSVDGQDTYDCIVSYGNHKTSRLSSYFHLKSYTSRHELKEMEEFLASKLKEKNELESYL